MLPIYKFLSHAIMKINYYSLIIFVYKNPIYQKHVLDYFPTNYEVMDLISNKKFLHTNRKFYHLNLFFLFLLNLKINFINIYNLVIL